jgi:hypothetical protein
VAARRSDGPERIHDAVIALAPVDKAKTVAKLSSSATWRNRYALDLHFLHSLSLLR